MSATLESWSLYSHWHSRIRNTGSVIFGRNRWTSCNKRKMGRWNYYYSPKSITFFLFFPHAGLTSALAETFTCWCSGFLALSGLSSAHTVPSSNINWMTSSVLGKRSKMCCHAPLIPSPLESSLVVMPVFLLFFKIIITCEMMMWK